MIGNPTAEQVTRAGRLVDMGLSANEVAKRVRITLDEAIRIASERSYDWEIADLEPTDLAE